MIPSFKMVTYFVSNSFDIEEYKSTMSNFMNELLDGFKPCNYCLRACVCMCACVHACMHARVCVCVYTLSL